MDTIHIAKEPILVSFIIITSLRFGYLSSGWFGRRKIHLKAGMANFTQRCEVTDGRYAAAIHWEDKVES